MGMSRDKYNAVNCSVSESTVSGWSTVVLANELLRVVVLPGKGADIYQLVHLQSDIDFMMKTPWGLELPGSAHREGSAEIEFLCNYEGGWQELFPSANDVCVFRGKKIPFHGEVATMAWHYDVVADSSDEVAVIFWVICEQTPFRLERLMRLRRGTPTLYLEEKVTNTSCEVSHFVWGHHCVLGAPFIEEGCRLNAPAQTLVTPASLYEASARLAPDQRSAWPMAALRAGGAADMRIVYGPALEAHDEFFLSNLSAGWVSVTNPRLDLTFSLVWDPAVFRGVQVWQPYGGAHAQPLTGIYGLGIEPWVTQYNLQQAIVAGEAIELAGEMSFSTELSATISPGNWSNE